MKKRNNKIRETNLGQGVRVNAAQIGKYNKKFFCTGDNKNNILIWAFGEEDPIQKLLPSHNQAAQTQVSALTFSYDENQIFSGSNRGIINIWDLQGAKNFCTLKGHTTSVNTFTTFPNNQNRLASGSYDTNIKLWDIRTKDSTITLKGHSKQINTLDISPDDNMLISGSEDGTIKLWDLRYPQKIITTFTQHTAPINKVKFNPEDIMFASASADRTAKYFQCQPGFYVYISTTDLNTSSISAIQFSEDGSLLYTASNDSLRVWKMGKDGMLVDTIESSWKGVQDLCMIQDTLVGIAFHNGNLSFWAHTTNSIKDQQQKVERAQQKLPCIKNNRSQQLKDVRNNIDMAVNIVSNLQKKQKFKKNLSSNQGINEKDSARSGRDSGRDSGREQPKKRNFLQELQKRKIEQQKRIQERKRQQEQNNMKKEIQLRRIKEQQKQQRKARQQQRLKRQEQDKINRQNAEKQAKRLQQQRRDAEIAEFNQKMAQQYQNKGQGNRLMESVLHNEKMDATLNASHFMIDENQKTKFEQYDTINAILKQSSKFGEVINFRMSRVKPILNWWNHNNIKSALYALNQAAASVVIDALNAIFTNGKMKSMITPQIATALCRKAAQLILDSHSQYVRNGILIINDIVCMYKQDLVRIKNFSPGTRVDITRQQRIAKYDRLIESFLGVFKMDRIRKYSKTPAHQLHDISLTLYRHLEEILRKWNPKQQPELAN